MEAEYGLFGLYGVFSVKCPSRPRAAEDFVRAHVVEELQPAGAFSGSLEQVEGPHDIGLDKVIRAHDGAVHVGFGREVADRVHPVLVERPRQAVAVPDIGLLEEVAPRKTFLQAGEVFPVAGVGQRVQVDHPAGVAGFLQQVADEVAADEAAAAGHQNAFHDPDPSSPEVAASFISESDWLHNGKLGGSTHPSAPQELPPRGADGRPVLEIPLDLRYNSCVSGWCVRKPGWRTAARGQQ